MSERGTLVLGAMVGAVVGAAVGFLFFTERGQQLRQDLAPDLERLAAEAARLRTAMTDVRRGFDDLVGRT
ncbi:MAG: hypothetical protein AB1635_04330 [Acidobacteriota bacterium]